MPGSFLRPGHLCWSFWCTASLTPRTVQRSWRISPASSTALRNRRHRRTLSHALRKGEICHTRWAVPTVKITAISHSIRELHRISVTLSESQGGGSHYAESVHILEVNVVKYIRRRNAKRWPI